MFNVILGNPNEENYMLFGKKNMVEYKQLLKEGGAASASIIAADIVGNRVTSPFLAEKILNMETIKSSPAKVVLYRTAQAASDVTTGMLMAPVVGGIAQMLNESKESTKKISRAAIIGGVASAALKLSKSVKAFGENAQSASALLAEEKARLPQSTSAYLTSKNIRTNAYLTSRNVKPRTNAYLTSKNAVTSRTIGTSMYNLA